MERKGETDTESKREAEGFKIGERRVRKRRVGARNLGNFAAAATTTQLLRVRMGEYVSRRTIESRKHVRGEEREQRGEESRITVRH